MRRFFWLLCVITLLTACDGMYSGSLIFDGRHEFGPETYLPGDLFLRAGAADFAAGSRVGRSVYMLGGTLTMDGTIGGDLIILDGVLSLGPAAVVSGDLRLGGGEVQRAETAVIQGTVVEGGDLQLPLERRPNRASLDYLVRTLVNALLLATCGAFLAHHQPQSLVIVAQAAVEYPLLVGALGLLVLVTLPPLMVMMAFTVVLIPLVLIVALLLALLLAYGVVAFGYRLGHWLACRWASWRKQAVPDSPAGKTFVGTLLLTLLLVWPPLGGVLGLVTAMFIFGALLLTRFGICPYRSPIVDAPDLASYARPTP